MGPDQASRPPLSSALPLYQKGMTRAEVVEYLLAVLRGEGSTGNTSLLASAVERWRAAPGLAFGDAHLAALLLKTAVLFIQRTPPPRGRGDCWP